jgi:putative methionine-R-sulfoxide reductase with GAF domain
MSDVELARVFADAAKVLAAQESMGRTAEELVALAVEVVPGADAAGLSLARNGTVVTFAATGELASACDAAQYDTGEGPCLQAVWEDRVLRVEDFTTETRWPAFSARAADLGARSLLAAHLSSERGSVSALNLYARKPSAFDEQSRTIAVIYAAHATIALEASRLEGDLRAAVETRQGIGQAVGIVMERHDLTAKQAFDLLVRSSQKVNVKLRDLADAVVTDGVDPTDTGVAARAAANEAGDRASELHEQRRSGGDGVHGSTRAQLDSARRRAEVAGERAISSLRRAVDAKFAAARAHDRAAQLHEKQAAAGKANVVVHERQAALHRQAAVVARAAAQAELDQLDQLEQSEQSEPA